jgi:hypothetical protein
LFLSFLGILTACTPTLELEEQVIVTAYATSAATPWLADLYACAADSNTVINLSAESPDISLRIGEPETLVSPAYKIGEEEILIVTGSESPLAELTLEEAQILFTQGNPSVQVWVYPSDVDVQTMFDQLVMKGRNVNSFARIAANPQEMSEALQSNPNAVGILPHRYLTDELQAGASAGSVPVLALTGEKPQGAIINLISCLQDS